MHAGVAEAVILLEFLDAISKTDFVWTPNQMQASNPL